MKKVEKTLEEKIGLINTELNKKEDTINAIIQVLSLPDSINNLKYFLEVNAGRLAEPLLKQGKQPKDDKDCHKAFLMLAHLSEIENYLKDCGFLKKEEL